MALHKHKLEKELKESEERYRIAIEHSNDGVAIVQGDHHVFVNRKFLDMFGYENKEEVLHKPFSCVAHPDDAGLVVNMNRRRQMGEPVPSRYEFKGRKKTGETVYIEVSVTKTSYNGKPCSLAYLSQVLSMFSWDR